MLNFCFGNVTLAQDDHGLNEAHNSESDSPVRELETPISPDTVTRAEESETNPNQYLTYPTLVPIHIMSKVISIRLNLPDSYLSLNETWP